MSAASPGVVVALLPQRPLRRRRGVPLRDRRGDAGRVRGDHQGRLHAADRLPRPRHGPAHPVRRPRPDGVPQAQPRCTSRRSTTRSRNIPPERLRMHLCWGNYEGPHHSRRAAHRHHRPRLRAQAERDLVRGREPPPRARVEDVRDVKLPDGKVLIPGVIESKTNFIEHPEADRAADRPLRRAGRPRERDRGHRLRLRHVGRPGRGRPGRRVGQAQGDGGRRSDRDEAVLELAFNAVSCGTTAERHTRSR